MLAPRGIAASRGALTVTALLAGGALIAGCGGSSDKPSVAATGSSPAAPLLRAADLSSKAVGFRTTMELHESVAGTTVDGTGSGSFNVKPENGSMVMNMTIRGQSITMRAVFAHGIYYMKLPSQLLSQLGAVTPWVSVSLNDVGRYAKIPGFGSFVSSESSQRTPDQYLDYLKTTADGSVRNLGRELVGGVETTHYRAALQLSKLPSSVPPAQRATAEQLVKVLRQRLHASYSPFDVWIDQAGLVREFRMSSTASINGENLAVTMTERYIAYGPQPTPRIPSASQTTDLISLLHAASG